MLDSARDVVDFSRGRSRADLDTDRQLVLALVKAIEIIGEAAYQVSADTRQGLPGIPWEDLVGMRHRLVHAYFDVNLDILWRTATEDVPFLAVMFERSRPAD
jgi:uncharacterized protein with HEPN domain